MPWTRTVRTCGYLLKHKEALWTFLGIEGIKPTTNAAGRAPRQAVIHRKTSHGIQSAKGALCRSRLLTVVTPPGNRAETSGPSWNRPGLPIIAETRCPPCFLIPEALNPISLISSNAG